MRMKKKLLRFFLIAGILVSISALSFTGYSYAQSFSLQPIYQSEDSKTFIFVQTLLRNSNGQLITYLGSDQFTDIDVFSLESLLTLEDKENDPIITINGKQYKVIKRGLTIPQERENVIASTILASTLGGETTWIARFAHDGYHIIEGDQVTTIWTFIRPIQQ